MVGKVVEARPMAELDTTPEQVRSLRRALGMSQEQFATHLGVSISSVRDWEQGRRKPRGLYRRTLQAETNSMLEPLVEVIPQGANFSTNIKLADILLVNPAEKGATLMLRSAPTAGGGPTTVVLPVVQSEEEIRKLMAAAKPKLRRVEDLELE
jgi:putative transcriptional regulator